MGAPSLTETAASGGEEPAKQPQEAGAKHSGKLLVRMPATLHDELARAAETEGVSLNQWITGALASAVGWKGGGELPPVKAGSSAANATDAEPKPVLSARSTRIALMANLVVLVVAGAAAIALLVAAWQSGF